MTKKVFVSGCYDMLYSGHVAFFEEAATHGELYVGLGSDATMYKLKGRKTINSEKERLYMVQSLKVVKEAWINSGSGLLDFENELKDLLPDIFFVNEDGYSLDKESLCNELGIEILVSKKAAAPGLTVRHTTAIRKECRIPYRLDLGGGWLDQPFVSKYCPGSVITISVEPDIDFNDRSGMSSSTRAKAIELWHTHIPGGNKEKLAKTLFCVENPPGSKFVCGSQDSIGLVFPGVNRLDYPKESYWPSTIESITDKETLKWVEKHLWLINLSPREESFDVLSETDIDEPKASALAEASSALWQSIKEHDLTSFGHCIKASFEAQISMFPKMLTKKISSTIKTYEKEAIGWKLSGAGGGGYLVLVSEHPIKNAIQIRIRR